MKNPALAAPGTPWGQKPAFTIGRTSISRHQLLVAGLFVLGCLVRLFGIGSMVSGVNSDEASIGYDAWAIANYGMDRNLTPLPAYLIAWGSGQNAGYAWLLLPFVKVLGLSTFSVRLPMALVGCVSLWALYTILRRHTDPRLATLGLFLLAICPWHVLKSRWALESNLFPDLLLWGVALLCAGLARTSEDFGARQEATPELPPDNSASPMQSTKKNGILAGPLPWFYAGFFVLGLSAWGYATSFVMLPLFVVPAALYMCYKKWLPLPHLFGCAAAFLLGCWPILLFAVINMLDLPAIELPFLTIPKLVASRAGEFAFLAQNPIATLSGNIKNLFSMILAQDDGMSWSVVQGFGLIYQFSLPLAIAGFLRAVLPANKGGKLRRLVPGGWIFTLWLVAAAIMACTISPNVNRSNGLWFPLVWFWILGVYEIITIGVFWRRFAVSLYAVFFLLFCNTTLKVQNDRFNVAFDGGFVEAVQYVDALDKPVYVSGASPAYIKVLFATTPSPQEFQSSITQQEIGAFGNVYQWGKWTVAEPENPQPSGDYAIVVRDGREGPYLEAGWQLTKFEYFWAGTYEQ